MELNFSPQAIQFSGNKKEEPAVVKGDYGAQHSQLERLISLHPENSPWRERLYKRLQIQESRFRCDWIEQQIKILKQCFSNLIEQVEDPEQIHSEATQDLRQQLLANFTNLRHVLQVEYLPLIKKAQYDLGVIQNLVMAQLNRLDALQLMSAAAFEKAVLISLDRRKELANVGGGVLPDELLALLALEELLDAAARYQFSWNRMKTYEPQAMSKLQEIAIQGLMPGMQPRSKRHPEGELLGWQGEKAVNRYGLVIDIYRKPYIYWMKTGIQMVQRAMKEKFHRMQPLEQALEAFYAAFSIEPDHLDAPLALAWILSLLDQPVYALDFLEYCLRLEARPEVQELYMFLQANNTSKESKNPVKRT